MKIKTITLGSLFDGIGGFPYAASLYGIRPLWASEILPECVSVTRKHFPEMAHVGDITLLHGASLPPVDIITFGSPCQGLSLAGRRRGLADERSGLFMEAVRIIYEMKEATHDEYPKIAVWENVPGALSSAGGRDYQAVLEAFTKAKIPMPGSGRWANAGMVRSPGADIAWVMYDAQYFGTAQRRRRLFVVGDFAGRRAGQILFVPKSMRGYFKAGAAPGQGTAAHAENGAGGAGGRTLEKSLTDGGAYCIAGNIIGRKGHNGGEGMGWRKDISYTLTASDRHAVYTPKVKAVEILNDQGGSFMTVERSGISPTLRSQTHGNLPIVAVDAGALCMGTSQTNAGILENRSPTLTCAHGQAPILAKPKSAGFRIRRLTPLECERLQGYPDFWTEWGHDGEKISDGKRYRMLGNSVAVPCVAYIMQGIRQALIPCCLWRDS